MQFAKLLPTDVSECESMDGAGRNYGWRDDLSSFFGQAGHDQIIGSTDDATPVMNKRESSSVFWRDEALPFIEARSVGDGRRVCYAKHSHETFSIGAITSGSSTYLNNDVQSRIRAGALVMMNPGDVHACNPIDGQPWAYRMLYVDALWLAKLQHEHGALHVDFQRYGATMINDPGLYESFNRFFDNLTAEHCDRSLKHAAAVEFFSEMDHRLRRASIVGAQQKSAKLERAAEFIAQNYRRQLKLSEICEAVNVSPSSLIRSFRKQYGMTPHAYLINRRIQFARAELRTGKPIADVALDAGFADQAHLQRAFKQLLAATPGHYRGS